MNQLTLIGRPAPQAVTSSVVTPKTTVSTKLSQDKHYTREYLLNLIATDMYIFDIRYWQNGITKQEFFKRWNNSFSGDTFTGRNGDGWNVGHFAHVLRELKNANAIDPEDIWAFFLQHKDNHLRAQVRIWKQTAEWEYKVASNARTQEDCEQCLFYAIRSWGDMNCCLRELGKTEEPLPCSYSNVYPDPMYWGEVAGKKPECKNTKKEV